jgi:hypothetical protein
MRSKILVSVLVAATLALTSGAVLGAQKAGGGGDRTQQMDHDRDYDRDRMQDRTQMDADRDRDRDQDRVHQDGDMDQDRDQDRDRIHVEDPAAMTDAEIYGGALMTAEERNQYRKQMQNLKTVQEREQYQVQHEKQMQDRARVQGKDLVPPGQGEIYGGEFMTVQERNQYREQLRRIGSEEEKRQFMAQHREEMQLRASALDKEIEEAE